MIDDAAATIRPDHTAASVRPTAQILPGPIPDPDPTPKLTVAISSPTTGSVISGAQPGFAFQVSGTYVAYLVTNLSGSVTIDGFTYPVTIGGGTWSATIRGYKAGTDTATVTIRGTSDIDGAHTASKSVSFTVQLTTTTPVFTVNAPAQNTPVKLYEGGGSVAVTVSTSDQYGPRTVLVTGEGQTVTLAQQSATQYGGTLSLTPMPLGQRNYTVICRDRYGNSRSQGLTLIGVDAAPPKVTIDNPSAGSNVVADVNQDAVVRVSGTIKDVQSGVASISWALTPTGTRQTVPVSGPGIVSWAADIAVHGFGGHTVYVWGTDKAGNTMPDPVDVSFNLINSYTPTTLDERLDGRAYLVSLLNFAHDQVTVPNMGGVLVAQLSDVLGQPLDRLSQPLSTTAEIGRRPINELRVPVELLRRHIADKGYPTTKGAAGAARYLTTAYNSLLAWLGTSYAELRLARGAVPADRAALAQRLGLTLSDTRPDELDQLLLDGAELTEAALETTFGLLDTTPGLDVLRAGGTPLVLAWQTAAQELSWAKQDRAPARPRTFAVMVDPDVVTADDVVATSAGNPVRKLISDRTTALASFVTSLDDARAATGPTAALNGMTAIALPGVDLAALETTEATGGDISADLAAAGLTESGFRYLRQLARLAASGTVTDTEWASGVAVLVGAHKQGLYPTWRDEEAGLVLSPDLFVLGQPGPAVDPYRVDPRARGDWQALLRTRIEQGQALAEGLAGAVAEAEHAALPILRDALLADIEAATGNTDPGELMTAWYSVDMKSSGALRTTRLAQATQSLQSLLFVIRSVGLPAGHPAVGWTLTLGRPDFDSGWRWMGDLGSWRTAVQAFLFPERHLDPALLVPRQPTPLSDLWSAISGSGEFGPADAVAAAEAYLAAKRAASSTFPTFTYLDPQRSATHQSGLASLSASLPDAREVFWAVPLLIAQRLQAAGQYLAALDWFWLLYPYDVAKVGSGGYSSCYHVINNELANLVRPDLTFPPNWTGNLNPFDHTAERTAPYTRYTLLALVRCHLDFADAEFTLETDESVAEARSLYLTAQQLVAAQCLQPLPPINPGEPALPIPELTTLASRATVQLAKLRQGRNVAGMLRSQAVLSGAAVVQPTPYRYKVLLERARQLIAQASQVETGYLAALEKYDAKTLQLYDAKKALAVAGAQVDLQTARVAEAADAVVAAQAQQAKADAMAQVYQQNIDAPPNRYEQALLDSYPRMRDLRNIIAGADMTLGIAQAAGNACSLFSEVFSFGGAAASAAVEAAAWGVKGATTISLNNLEAQNEANQLMAGIEQRRNEWRIQQAAAQQDSLVAARQVTVSRDQQAIADQERQIAQMQNDQAAATLKLLTTQFTNPDLYQWMSRTLGEVYRFFLQQATATARLAQAQLGFERAEQPQTFVLTDYWQSPADLTSTVKQPDRRGLTGSARLAEDLARLDEYAFATDRRKLNLSQTFSIAQLMPAELLDFRQTGTLSFATTTNMFDVDFPGHYLRLIRQVRVSLVALVPPGRGIRASLSSNGVSRVTVPRDGGFTDVVLRHDPTVVALTSPVNATGTFQLDIQSDMLLPFEGSGVDTTWEFQLPKAANPFDFGSIVDVLVTVDYTALPDGGYRTAVVERLNADRSRGADCVFSLARDFPDQWYALNNPAPGAARAVTLTLRDVDFPVNIEDLTTAAVGVRLGGRNVPATLVSLHRGANGGDAMTNSGTAGTRRGNAATWTALCGTSPVGDWQLSFGTDADALFTSGDLDDILLVIGWAGRAPAWPA